MREVPAGPHAPAATSTQSVKKPASRPTRMPHMTSLRKPKPRLTFSSSMTTYRIEPAASVRKATETALLTHTRPSTVPRNVGPPADEAEQGKEAPARQRALAGDGRDDAEALRRIVQAEADDQDQCEADLPRGRRLADGEPLGGGVRARPG